LPLTGIILVVLCAVPPVAFTQDANPETLLQALMNRRAGIEANADWLLEKVCTGPATAIARLDTLVHHDPHGTPDKVRLACALALKNLSPAHLGRALVSPFWSVRNVAATALLGTNNVFGTSVDLLYPVDVNPAVLAAHALLPGPPAAALLEGLRSMDPARRVIAAAALRVMRPRLSVPRMRERFNTLITALGSKKSIVRWGAALGLRLPHLRWTDRDSRISSVDALTKSLKDGVSEVRWAAAETLGSYYSEKKRAAPALMRGIEDSNEIVAAECIFALARLQASAYLHDAESRLILLLSSSPSPLVRSAAARGLGLFHSEGEANLKALVRALKDSHPAVRKETAASLGNLRGAALPALLHAVRDEDGIVRRVVLHALHALDPDNEKVLQVMCHALRDRDPEVRHTAVKYLRTSGIKATVALPILVEALRDSEAKTRAEAAGMLASFGQRAVRAAPALVLLLADEDRSTQNAARGALLTFGKASIPPLKEALKHPKPALMTAAVELLVTLGEFPTRPVLPLLESRNRDLRDAAVAAVARIGPSAVGAVPALVRMLQDEDDALQAQAAWALGKIGPGALRMLGMELDSKAESTRIWSRWCVVQIARLHGSNAREARRLLYSLLDAREVAVRENVVPALLRIGFKPRDAFKLIPRVKQETGVIPKPVPSRFKKHPARADEAARALASRFKDASPACQLLLISALARSGLQAITGLTRSLHDREVQVRQGAARALNLAAGKDPELLAQVIRNGYGVMVLDGGRNPRVLQEVAGVADSLSREGYARALGLLLEALSRYPVKVIKGRMKKIVLVRTLTIGQVRYGGTVSGNTLYLAAGGLANCLLIQMFHHEFSSILLRGAAFPGEKWSACNPTSFAYDQGGMQAILTGRIGEGTTHLHHQGFFRPYAQADLEEDFNVFSEMVLTYPFLARTLIDLNPRLEAKWRVWNGFFQSLQ